MPNRLFLAGLTLLAMAGLTAPLLAAPPVVPLRPPGAEAAGRGTDASGGVRAPTADERQAFADGLRLFEAGDARGAELSWRQGYAAGHDPAFLVRIAEAQEKAGAPAEAVRSYEQYLREAPQAADREEIEGRLNRLNPGRKIRQAPQPEANAEAAGEMTGRPGAAVPPQPGSPGSPGSPHAAPSTSATPNAPAAGAAVQAQDDSLQDLMPLVQDEPPRSRLNLAGWIGTGVTVLLLGVAAFYGASAAEKSGDANRELTYSNAATGVPMEYSSRASQFEEDVRVGRRDDKLAKGFLIAAAVGAVASTVLFVLDGSSAASRETGTSASNRGGRQRDQRRGVGLGVGLGPIPETAGAAAQASLSWSF